MGWHDVFFGPAVYITYNEDGYYIGETSKGIRSKGTQGRGVDLDDLMVAIPAPANKHDRCAVETGHLFQISRFTRRGYILCGSSQGF